MKTKLSLLAFVCIPMAQLCLAQPTAPARPARVDPGPESPVIEKGGQVTFRLRAPEAKSVTVSGDFGADAAMKKGDGGVWSVTVGPLEPEMHVYHYMVDGVRLLDPGNPQAKIGYVTSTITSLFTVPTKEPAFYDVRDVPHGEIRTHLYKSKSNGVIRELTVYVPPGYDDHVIRCSISCTASRTITTPGIATAEPMTSSTTYWLKERLIRSSSSCPWATVAPA